MATSTSQLLNNLANMLPSGTFLAFQTLAPVFTNNGDCGVIEQVMSSLLMFIFSIICFLLCFTDSFTKPISGHVYYGIVTTKGLYNPRFKQILSIESNFYIDPANSSQYLLKTSDFLQASLSVVLFCTLSLLTQPLQACYYSGIPSTITKTVPIIVGLLIGIVFGFSPPARHGLGFSLASIGQNPNMALGGDAELSTSASYLNLKQDSKAFLLKNDHAAKGTNGATEV